MINYDKKKISEALCWNCKNCNDSCEWVEHWTLPQGALAVDVENSKFGLKKIIRCPNFEKLADKISRDDRFSREGYESLRAEIIKNVVNEYINALFVLKIFDEVGSLKAAEARGKKRECERFFASEWFMMLCDLDGKALSKRLRKYVNETWGEITEHFNENGKFPEGTPSIVTRNRKAVERKLFTYGL